MPTPRPLPAEAFNLSHGEIIDICVAETPKELGGLIVAGDEAVPCNGWDEAGDGLIIARGERDCVILHVDEVTGAHRLQHDLVLAASYIALHRELRDRQYVVGVTFEPLGRLAVRRAGFSTMRISNLSSTYKDGLEAAYHRLRTAERRPLEPVMVYTPTHTFIDRYGSKQTGTDPDALINELIASVPLPSREDDMVQPSDDPIIEAIRRTTNTMRE